MFSRCYMRNPRRLIASRRKQLQNNFTQMLVSLLFIAKAWILPRNRYIWYWYFGFRRMKLERCRSGLRAHPWKTHLLFGTLFPPSAEKGWAAHDSCYGCHGTQGTCLSQRLLTFSFTLVFDFLFYLAEKLIRGQRQWLKSVLLCVEAQAKNTLFFSHCKLCKTTIFNSAVCSRKNYTHSALGLSTNIWKSTKYVMLVAFSLFS